MIITDSKIELKRKSVHMLTTIIPIAYFFVPQRELFLWIIAGLFSFALIIELLRINVTKIQHIYENYFGNLLRPVEKGTTLNGATILFLGSFLSVWLFPVNIAVAALLLLTISDGLAAVVGTIFGRHPVYGKTWEGFLAFFLSAWLIIYIVLDEPLIGGGVALVTAGIELLPVKVNDNLLIPLASGTFLMFLR